MASEYPKTLYRYAPNGERQGHTFKTADDVPDGQGWVAFEDLGEPPVPLAKEDSDARIVALTNENEALRKALEASDVMNADLTKRLARQEAKPKPKPAG